MGTPPPIGADKINFARIIRYSGLQSQLDTKTLFSFVLNAMLRKVNTGVFSFGLTRVHINLLEWYQKAI